MPKSECRALKSEKCRSNSFTNQLSLVSQPNTWKSTGNWGWDDLTNKKVDEAVLFHLWHPEVEFTESWKAVIMSDILFASRQVLIQLGKMLGYVTQHVSWQTDIFKSFYLVGETLKHEQFHSPQHCCHCSLPFNSWTICCFFLEATFTILSSVFGDKMSMYIVLFDDWHGLKTHSTQLEAQTCIRFPNCLETAFQLYEFFSFWTFCDHLYHLLLSLKADVDALPSSGGIAVT